ncbi:Vacuolar protein sorting-associated protein 41-like protein, partial [Thalictrum thalictroides]
MILVNTDIWAMPVACGNAHVGNAASLAHTGNLNFIGVGRWEYPYVVPWLVLIYLNFIGADCVNLLVKYDKEVRHAICIDSGEDEARPKRATRRSTAQAFDKSISMRAMGLKSRTREGE